MTRAHQHRAARVHNREMGFSCPPQPPDASQATDPCLVGLAHARVTAATLHLMWWAAAASPWESCSKAGPMDACSTPASGPPARIVSAHGSACRAYGGRGRGADGRDLGPRPTYSAWSGLANPRPKSITAEPRRRWLLREVSRTSSFETPAGPPSPATATRPHRLQLGPKAPADGVRWCVPNREDAFRRSASGDARRPAALTFSAARGPARPGPSTDQPLRRGPDCPGRLDCLVARCRSAARTRRGVVSYPKVEPSPTVAHPNAKKKRNVWVQRAV